MLVSQSGLCYLYASIMKAFLALFSLSMIVSTAQAQLMPSHILIHETRSHSGSFLEISENGPLKLNAEKRNDSIIQMDLEHSKLMANLASDVIAGINAIKMDPQKDKERHFLVGHVIGNVTSGAMQIILPKYVENRKLLSTLTGFGASVLIGLAKEYRDGKGYGHADATDAIATSLGGICGSITMSI